MIKMIGNYTRPEELLTKLVNENTNLKARIAELERKLNDKSNSNGT